MELQAVIIASFRALVSWFDSFLGKEFSMLCFCFFFFSLSIKSKLFCNSCKDNTDFYFFFHTVEDHR